MSHRAIKEMSHISNSVYRAVLFILVTAPATALFVGFIFLSFNNSIAGTFLSEARSYVSDTPADKVRVCLFKKKTEQMQAMGSTKPSPISAYKEKCMTTLIDSGDWQQSADSIIRKFYWNTVFLGFLIWCILNVNFSVITEKIRTIKHKNKL